ncbi:gentisate 1,2-dioxygenase [Variovorax paradoxus]|uniref:gentisate 1,2-dioxygenase n=1 Tax=Variovorax paradoxus TaxID=34073 RepID=UPI0029C81A88|nr:gentisate 1,2-dioxygenase [Variovorax paradoxus]WPH17523.1 gentisate 1,2-dioxygenase [Variovorax paradoxus]WPH24155.1 gentisate 1,2-dioxygenase [Variovorax paradoxus]
MNASTEESARERYYEQLQPLNLAPLWSVLKGLVPAQPVPAARACMWSWNEVYPQLLRAGELITAEEAERRVLVLENPGLAGKSQVTDTLYAGLQLILPGETAPAHRHTQSALRFVLHGSGAYTAVDGEKTPMHRGDFIITPHWTWHDHGHDGDEPVVWLDGLDVPLVTFLRAGFREEFSHKAQSTSRSAGDSAARFGSGLLPIDHTQRGLTSPMFCYPYARAREAIEVQARTADPDPHLGVCLRYINPATGGWAMPTIGAVLRYYPGGFVTRPYRSTDSTVLVGLEGEAEIRVNGYDALCIGPNDVAVVPGWSDWTVAARRDTLLFSYSDRPVHEKLGLLREARN